MMKPPPNKPNFFEHQASPRCVPVAIAWLAALLLATQLIVQFGFGGWKNALNWARSVDYQVRHRERIDPDNQRQVPGIAIEIGMDYPQPALVNSPESSAENVPTPISHEQRKVIERQTRYLRGVVVIDLNRQLSDLDDRRDELPDQTYEYQRGKLAATRSKIESQIAANETALIEADRPGSAQNNR